MTEETEAAAPAIEQAQAAPAVTETATPAPSVPNAEAAPENADASGETVANVEGQDADKKNQSRSERYRRKISAQAGVIERIETERQALQRELESLRTAKASDTPPNPSDFAGGEYDPVYIAKLSAHESLKAVSAKLNEREQREDSERQTQAAIRAKKLLDESAAKLRENIPDFDATLQSFIEDGGEFGPHVRAALAASGERAALIAYHLTKDPDLVDRLNGASREEAFLEIGELRANARLPQPRTQTKAPAPLSSLKGGAAATKDPKDMSMPEYIAWRKGQSK